MTTVLVFDFDGVLVPSEKIKIDAYRDIFTEFGEAAPEASIIEEAREEFAGAKGNRFDIIRSMLKRSGSFTEERVQALGGRYSTLVEKKIFALGVDASTRIALENLRTKYSLYVNSNNPDDALQRTLDSLDLSKYFKAIFGSSRSKLENLKEIAAQEHAQPQEIVFVGDGEGDKYAAESFGCRFIGIANDINGWGKKQSFTVVDSVAEIGPHC